MLEIKRRSRNQSRFALPVSAKLGVGILIMGAGFIVLAIAQGRAESAGKVGPQWLFLTDKGDRIKVTIKVTDLFFF